MVDHSVTQDAGSNPATSTENNEVTISKELLLWLVYNEQMWKTLCINYAVAGGEEAQKFGSDMLRNYKKQYPTTEGVQPHLDFLLKNTDEMVKFYSGIHEQIEDETPSTEIITEL